MKKSITYKDAGVNIDKANDFVSIIKKLAKKSGTKDQIGGFGALFPLNLKAIKNPVLVSSTDGVGTKLNIAFKTNKHNSIGIDLVAMCVNDLVVQGAKPLFFLDYMAVSKLDNKTAEAIIKGIVDGCVLANCALIGGETAEMPGLYKEKEYDLAGFTVGIVDKDKIINGKNVKVGDSLIGIASSGLHSNGFSLVRKIVFDVLKMKTTDFVPELNKTLGEELLTPTKIYVKTILSLIKKFEIKSIAHITGGGLLENIIRVVPESVKITIHKNTWETLPIFSFLQKKGNIEDIEMLRVFNNGIGMTLVVDKNDAKKVISELKKLGENAFLIGEITKKTNQKRIEFI